MTDAEDFGLGIEPHVDLFAATVLRFRDPAGWQQLVPADQRSGDGLEVGQCHIISAVHSHQVFGGGRHVLRNVSTPHAFSARRHIDLQEELEERGTWLGEAVGFAPDLSYGELSVAVGGLTREEAVDVGRRFGQVAIFEIDDHMVKIVGCLVEGVLRERPYSLRFVGDIRPCPMFGGLDAEGGRRCSPPAVRAAGQTRDSLYWWERWWQAYGLLGCDVCRAQQGRS